MLNNGVEKCVDQHIFGVKQHTVVLKNAYNSVERSIAWHENTI